MTTKKPSELEKERAVRYLRHRETCRKCFTAPGGKCDVALAHHMRWMMTYYKEARGMCKHFEPGECWEDRCRGGKKARA